MLVCLPSFSQVLGYHQKETREGWPLLTVETEANGDLWITNEGGPSLVRGAGIIENFILPWLLWSAQCTLLYFSLCVPWRRAFTTANPGCWVLGTQKLQ
jgi:hypothetical protein